METTNGSNVNSTNGENKGNKNARHHGILGAIDEAINQLNTDFPLSGGETEEDFGLPDEIEEDAVKKEHLDTNFPLSGGTPD